jgi:hypothetical protein
VVGSSGGGGGEVGLSGGGGGEIVWVVVGYPSTMATMPMSPPSSQSSWVPTTHQIRESLLCPCVQFRLCDSKYIQFRLNMAQLVF